MEEKNQTDERQDGDQEDYHKPTPERRRRPPTARRRENPEGKKRMVQFLDGCIGDVGNGFFICNDSTREIQLVNFSSELTEP